jgi:hypothetical protein
MNKVTALALVASFLLATRLHAQPVDEGFTPRDLAPPKAFQKLAFRGRVVYLAEAMERLHGVKSAAEAKENILALETPGGALYPLVEDKMGHSFRLDERLRATPMELLVRRYEGSPAVQVIRIHALEGDKKYLLDYWCDVCSIPMYELKPCDCCQGDVRLRKREVTPAGDVLPEAEPASPAP